MEQTLAWAEGEVEVHARLATQKSAVCRGLAAQQPAGVLPGLG